MLLVVIVDVVMLGVPFFIFMPSVAMLSVMAPIMCHNRCLLKFEKERFFYYFGHHTLIMVLITSDGALDFLVNQAGLLRHT
jgi:hypothetical protein